MSGETFYAVLDSSGAGGVFTSAREFKDFRRTSPYSVWKEFNDKGEAWNWITSNTTFAPESSSQAAQRAHQTSERELSAIDLSSSGSELQPEKNNSPNGSTTWHEEQPVYEEDSTIMDLDLSSRETSVEPLPAPPPPSQATPEVELSSEQLDVVRLCEQGESLFFTGSAGTGKSVCLRHIIRRLRELHGSDHVFVTASTGIAAINIGGSTLHSFAGVGLGKESVDIMYDKIMGISDMKGKRRRNSKPYFRWMNARILVIDEISMIDGRFFDKLEQLARRIRESIKPFGGIQLILCGDFFQLPPVPDSLSSGQKIPIKFAFEAESWSKCIQRIVALKKVFRQKEGDLITVLNMIRTGEIDPLGMAIFRSVGREVQYPDLIQPTELFPLRKQVEWSNKTRLEALIGEELTYYAEDKAGWDMFGRKLTSEEARRLLDYTLAPPELRLRPGAQVMLTVNIPDTGLVNGSTGIVVGYDAMRARFERVPQLDEAPLWIKVKTTKPDTRPQEMKSQDNGDPSDRKHRNITRWPVVRFLNGTQIQVTPARFEAVNAIGGVEATRIQLPLILAWAISIHKAQGQTLERIRVNMEGIFEKGQAYVALSRATSLQGLQVLNFDPNAIMTHPRVIAWSQSLEEMNGVEQTGKRSDSHDPDEEMYWAEVD